MIVQPCDRKRVREKIKCLNECVRCVYLSMVKLFREWIDSSIGSLV